MKSYSKVQPFQVLFRGTVYYAVQGGSNFESVNEIQKCEPSNESY